MLRIIPNVKWIPDRFISVLQACFCCEKLGKQSNANFGVINRLYMTRLDPSIVSDESGLLCYDPLRFTLCFLICALLKYPTLAHGDVPSLQAVTFLRFMSRESPPRNAVLQGFSQKGTLKGGSPRGAVLKGASPRG